MNVAHEYFLQLCSRVQWHESRREKSMAQRLYQLYKENGEEGRVEALTAEELSYVELLLKEHGGEQAVPGTHCYSNAQMLIVYDAEHKLRYWEGWIASEHLPAPLHHAWVTINGKVVDPAVEVIREADVRRKNEQFQYFGLEIPRKLVLRHIVTTEAYGPITEGEAPAKLLFRARH